MTLIGVVKQVGVEDKALADFHSNFFRKNKLFLDKQWSIYKALGSRKISFFTIAIGLLKSFRRHLAKGVSFAIPRGDVTLQGGILIFDRIGDLRFVIPEEYGKELNIAAIKEVIDDIREELSSSGNDE